MTIAWVVAVTILNREAATPASPAGQPGTYTRAVWLFRVQETVLRTGHGSQGVTVRFGTISPPHPLPTHLGLILDSAPFLLKTLIEHGLWEGRG